MGIRGVEQNYVHAIFADSAIANVYIFLSLSFAYIEKKRNIREIFS